MANKSAPKVLVDKEYVLNIINKHGYSIRSLCANPELDLSDKTIYRALNKGEMSFRTVHIIESFLNDSIVSNRPYGMTERRICNG